MTEQNKTVRKGRGRRRLLIALGVVLAVVGGVVALAPTVASSMAPGRIEGAVNGDIKGRVKVGKAKIGWFKTLEAGPIEVYDPSGALVARLDATAPVTVWKVLSGRWWSAKRLEIGTVEASGMLDLKQYNDGTTNLRRAFEPKVAKAEEAGKKDAKGSPTGKAAKPMPSIQAGLKLTKFDVTVRDEKDDFKSELGLKGLNGTASVDADMGAAGGGTVKAAADMSGTALVPGKGAAGSPMTFKLDADVKQNASGKWSADGIERAKVKLNLTNAPVAVADAIGQLGGALVEAMGDAADITADIDGNASAMGAAVKVTSAGLTTDANVSIKDGVLTGASGAKPLMVSMKSAAFLERLPQTREGVANAKQQIRLTEAPSVEITLEKLSVPLPKGGAGLAALDFRGANVGARVKISGMSGEVAIPESGGDQTKPSWKPFAVEPIELALNIDDLTKPVKIATGTRATLDGKPAGDIHVTIYGEGLLDSGGRVRALQPGAGYADKAVVGAEVKGAATALLQPIVSGIGLPIEMNTDVGPTLDLTVVAEADVKRMTGAEPAAAGAAPSALDSMPPVDVAIAMLSANVKGVVQAKVAGGQLTTTGSGIELTMVTGAPLVQRILSAGATADKPSTIAVSGKGGVEVTAKDVRIALEGTRPEKIVADGKGVATITVSDLIVAPDMGGSKGPVRVDLLTAAMTLVPGSAPKVAINSGLAHEGSTFAIDGEIALEGLRKGMPKSKGPGVLAEVNPTGTIAVKNLPRSALWIVGGLNDKFSENGAGATKDETARAIATAVREAIGANLTATVKLMPAGAEKGGGQFANVKVETANKGVSGDVWARVTEKEAELSSMVLIAGLNPATLNPVLAALNKPVEGAQPTPPMKVGAASKVYVEVKQPVKVPFVTGGGGGEGAGGLDWAKAGDVNVQIAMEGDAVVEGVVMEDARATGGSLRTATVALRGLKGNVLAPLSGLDPKLADSKRVTVKLNADAIDKTSGEHKIATLAVDATAGMSGANPDAEVTLTGVSTAHAEALLGKKDLLVGALGETAEIKIKAKPMAAGSVANTTGAVTTIDVQMTSPRVSGASIGLAMDETKIFTTKPSTITWTPNAAFINKYLLGGQEASATNGGNQPPNRARDNAGNPGSPPASLSLQEARPITIQIDKFSVAKPVGADAAKGTSAVGLMKPGVFDLGLSVNAPSMSVLVPGSAGGAATAMTIEGLTIAVKSLPPEGSGASPIEASLNVAKVSGAGADAGKASTAKIKLTNLADAAGNIDSKRAVVNADVDVAAFPTPIVDNLAKKGGLLTELLGPTVTLVATARNVTTTGDAAAGTVDATATSQRATAKLKGDVRNGVFVQTGPVDIEVKEIRTQLVEKLAGGLPLVESLEKTAQDAPALVNTESLQVPLDNDLTKLNGKVTVNPGVARFTTSNIMGQIIKGVGGKEGGAIGRKIEPFVVNISKGVATYERFKLPFGEFNLETRGQVDLVQKTINVVTYAPFFALSEEALGKIKLGIGGKLDIIDKATMVPITTKGPIGNTKTELDLGLFIKELGDRLLQTPGDLLKEPGKILENILGPKEKPAPSAPAPSNPAPTPKPPSATPPGAPPANPPAKEPEVKKPKKKKEEPKETPK